MKSTTRRNNLTRRFGTALTATAAMVLAAGMVSAASISVNSISEPGFGSADLDLDNDFTRIQSALTQATAGDTITLVGTFDISEPNAKADYVANGQRFTTPNIAGVDNVTVVGGGAGATLNINIDPTETIALNQYGFFLPSGRDGWTFDNLFFTGGWERAFRMENTNGTTIQNCSFELRPAYDIAYGIDGRSGQNDLSILNNTFTFYPNAAPLGGFADLSDVYAIGIVFGCCDTASQDNVLIDGNTFEHEMDPLGAAVPTTWCYAIFDNNNTNGGAAVSGRNNDLMISNNVFDGGAIVDGNPSIVGTYAYITTFRQGSLYATNPGTGVGILDNNIFRDYMIVANHFNPTPDPQHTMIFTNNVFENVGYYDPNVPLVFGSQESDEVYYAPAIENASASVYGTNGGSPVLLDLATQYTDKNSVTTTGIPFLNAVALDPLFFEMQVVDLDAGIFAQAGILVADVSDVPGTTFNRTVDDEWTFEDRWVRPTPEEADGPTDVSGEELAFGYNCFGNVIDEGDPLLISNDPSLDDPLIIELSADTEFAPATIIDRNVIIRTDPNVLKSAPANAVTISPTVKKLTSPLFLVEPGFSLTLENLVIDGDTPFNGVQDITGVAEVQASPGSGGAITLTNVTVRNTFGDSVNAGEDAVVTITDSTFENVGRVARLSKVADAQINNNRIVSAGDGVIWSGTSDASTLTMNVFSDVFQDLFFIGGMTDLDLGGAGMGNIFFGDTNFDFNGIANYPITNLLAAYNWSATIYGEGSNDQDGLIIGNVNVLNSLKDVQAGVRLHDPAPLNGGIFFETSIIAQFDRDLDAWPDAWEIDSAVTSYDVFDSDNDGWPDGVEAARGTNPNNNASFPAGVFDINADVDANGIADWYEEALLANLGIAPFIGDVLGDDGQAGLQDAVRALQIVNGAFGAKDLTDGDLNALDVTGLGPSSLGNPLQILRFQAGVRNKLPALAGIN